MNDFEFATFGAGCFWGVQATFDQVDGVVDTVVGFMGGESTDVSYEEVCTGLTGHAEVVRLRFNPKEVSYSKLLDVFWSCHDPTQKGGQGVNIGDQYRSIIFYENDSQKEDAEKSKKKIKKKLGKDIATLIEKSSGFARAEEYHQKYAEKHGRNVC